MEELQVIETTSGRQFKPWASREDVQVIKQETVQAVVQTVVQAVQDPASITAITSEIASGKQAIAAALTQKGVQDVSPTDSFNKLAQDIQSIQIQEITIDGGDMYAKQLYGVANNDITPGYWNLYQVMADLLSDARFSNYGGILLAEYFKGYDSIALSGAGAGGGYYTSDGAYYTDDVTHTWTDDLDGKGNRWVAYLFATESHGFTITDTNLCPRSIHIGRHVGVIESLVNGRISEIVVTDGNFLDDFRTGTYTQNWGNSVIFNNINHSSGTLFNGINNVITEKLYIHAKDITGGNLVNRGVVKALIVKVDNNFNGGRLLFDSNGGVFTQPESYISVEGETLNFELIYPDINKLDKLKHIDLLNVESVSIFGRSYPSIDSSMFISYKRNDRTLSVTLTSYYRNSWANFSDVEVKNGWCKNLNISLCEALTAENIVNHIFNRLGVNQPFIDDPVDANKLTITLGATNLAKLTAEEMQIAIDKGFTLA
ncbi:MAG: hypothetical protein II708_05005 [Paludibacteraceae bacterium]|nr:hypothetical protein [Paludibacteraceae bacterium]